MESQPFPARIEDTLSDLPEIREIESNPAYILVIFWLAIVLVEIAVGFLLLMLIMF